METTTLKTALVQYLMAMALPQELGFLHVPWGENPFISVNKRTGKKTCRIDDSELNRFREETGMELSRAEILSCRTMRELENLVGSKADKVPIGTLAHLILELTEVLGTIWNNLELVESLDEISDGGKVDPAYVWPAYDYIKPDPAEKEKLERECEGLVSWGRIGNISS
ncbi:MAG: hypothetical protein MJZ17_08350 [Bacteroidales bacterium]|nr:hypothetical protein [Bacteroidales bacterium]